MFWALSFLGLFLLLISGDFLVKGAIQLSSRLGVSALLVSLTVVAFGTSAPELIVAIKATLSGSPGLAMGNVVGSNIANILLVLGLPTLIMGLKNNITDTKRSFGFMIASFGTGIIFSMVTFSYFISSFSRVSFVIGLCMLSTGISLYTAFISTEFINILLSIFVSGVGTGGVYLLTISFLQATTDEKMRGRVFGNFYTIGRIALLLSFLTSGLAANYLDPLFASSGVETVLKISSLLILISGLITFISSYKKIFREFGIENSNFNNIKLDFKSTEDEPD